MKFNNKNTLKLTDIKISHQAIFKRYSENSELWMHFFLYLFLNKVKWVELNETLCIFQKDFFDKSRQLQSLPLGKKQKITRTLKYLINEGIISKILFVTEKDLDFIKSAGLKIKNSVKITEEFIYSTKDLIELSGKNYRKMRQHINWFFKNHHYKISNYERRDFKEVRKFLEIWWKQKTKNNRETLLSLREDFKNTKNAFDYLSKIDKLKCLTLKNDNKIIGISIFGFFNNKMAIHFIMKTLYKGHKGAAEFLRHEVAKNVSSANFLNEGGYGKSESLKAHKEGFHPVKINSIYKVYF